MIPFEKLFEPIVPPAGVDDPRAVLSETHEAFVASLRSLAACIGLAANIAEAAPWADELFDGINTDLGARLQAANDAFEVFKATRDCRGRS